MPYKLDQLETMRSLCIPFYKRQYIEYMISFIWFPTSLNYYRRGT